MKEQNEFWIKLEPLKERLWRYCLTITRSPEEAKDLLQDTIVTAYKNFEKLKSKEAFLSFLFGIASRINILNHRKKSRTVLVDDEILDAFTTDYQSPEYLADLRQLYEALEKLPEEQKEAIILFDIMGFSQKETAEIQNTKLETIKKRLQRGRTRLAELLGANNDLNIINSQKKIPVEGELK